MALDEQKLLQSYRMLHEVFPEDLHIARPLIHMLLQHELRAEAGDLALSMARRMLAGGHAAHASSFLSLCRQPSTIWPASPLTAMTMNQSRDLY